METGLRLTVFVVKHQDTFDDVLVPVHSVGIVPDYDLQITVTWPSGVRALCVSVSAASAHPHHLCGTTDRLN